MSIRHLSCNSGPCLLTHPNYLVIPRSFSQTQTCFSYLPHATWAIRRPRSWGKVDFDYYPCLFTSHPSGLHAHLCVLTGTFLHLPLLFSLNILSALNTNSTVLYCCTVHIYEHYIPTILLLLFFTAKLIIHITKYYFVCFHSATRCLRTILERLHHTFTTITGTQLPVKAKPMSSSHKSVAPKRLFNNIVPCSNNTPHINHHSSTALQSHHMFIVIFFFFFSGIIFTVYTMYRTFISTGCTVQTNFWPSFPVRALQPHHLQSLTAIFTRALSINFSTYRSRCAADVSRYRYMYLQKQFIHSHHPTLSSTKFVKRFYRFIRLCSRETSRSD